MKKRASHIRAFVRNEDGAALVEFALVVALFLFTFFAMLDMGRLMYSTTLSEKAAYMAVRTAIVRPSACTGAALPDRYTVGTAGTLGQSCRVGANVCAPVAQVSCAGVATNATANEIWNRIQPLMPPGSTIANVQFTYTFDPNLGFAGGPYTPMVTVDLNVADFQFVSPVGAFAAWASGASASNLASTAPFADISVSLPAEDLASGENG